MRPTLHVVQGPDRGMRFELPANEPQLVGRSSEALPLSDRSVSRRHAELTPDDGKWYVRDLESSNGTFVNGRRIDNRVELKPGDQIRCGSTLMIYEPVLSDHGSGDDERTTMVQLLDAAMFDLSVDRRIDANEDSMILASPDPLKAASEHLRVIYELTALTSLSLDVNELLNRVMDLIFEQFKPDRGFILFQTSPKERPTPAVIRYRRIEDRQKDTSDEHASRNEHRDHGTLNTEVGAAAERIPVSRTIIQHVLEKGDGILSTNAMNDARFMAGDSVQAYGIRSAICVPIRTADQVFGVIHIDSSIANFTFTEGQLRLMRAIGQHAGLALKGLELVEEKMRNERLAAIGQTVASLSHSIKNILQGLRGGADAIELALNKGDLQLAREGWPILSRNLDRIFNLTLNMLAYSKHRQLELEMTSISSLISEVAELAQSQCDRKQVGLILDLAEDMPPIPVDANALHQVLMNLLINAIEAVERKRGVITITSRFDAERHEALITVSDNGPGIPESMHEQVFEAFTSSKGQRGTGLGLAVSKKIVEEHGGRIELKSSPATRDGASRPSSHGCEFTIVLPSDTSTTADLMDTRMPRPLPGSQLDDTF